jgi:hypothetical protein
MIGTIKIKKETKIRKNNGYSILFEYLATTFNRGSTIYLGTLTVKIYRKTGASAK